MTVDDALKAFDDFIRDFVPVALHAHFADNDNNAAERVRQAIRGASALLGLPGLAVVQLASVEPARVVEHAALLRRQNYCACAHILEWDKLTDAQKVPWIIRAAAEREAGGEHR